MKSSYEVRAKRFIQQIFPYLEGCDTHFYREGALWAFNMDHHRKVMYSHGMTRYALITSDYVVKVNYDEDNVKQFGGGEEEIEFYEEAKKDGMEYLFAKITPYEYSGMTFYIMPRIKGIGKSFHDAWYYMTQEECDWCSDHELYDLHCENYGWKDGHIVIFDYGAHD